MKHAPTVISTTAVTEVGVGSSCRLISKEDFKLKDVASLALLRANFRERYLLTPRQIEPLYPRTSTIARTVVVDKCLPYHLAFSLPCHKRKSALILKFKKKSKSK